MFEALFWIHARSILERRGIQSDVRYRMDELFRASNISIAFPQRDVHLNTLSPLEIRVIKEQSPSGAS